MPPPPTVSSTIRTHLPPQITIQPPKIPTHGRNQAAREEEFPGSDGPSSSEIDRSMGLSSMPAPKDSLFTFLLYNTAVSIAILSDLLRAVMLFVGLPVPPPTGDDEDQPSVAAAASSSSAPTLADRFRSSFTPALFGARRRGAPDCRVCLARFEPESVVNRLPCGHLFHRACLETWLDYDHATCPLCRLRLLPAADDPPSPVPRSAAARIY